MPEPVKIGGAEFPIRLVADEDGLPGAANRKCTVRAVAIK